VSHPGRAVRVTLAVGALLPAALLVWSVLGMHRGLLLSDGLRGHFWPWAPELGRPSGLSPSASALSDPVWQFVPWVEMAKRELGAGRLPLWNPHQEAGQPLLANAQSALGSPLLWPALALPLFPGWNLSLLLRLLASAVGGYLLARDLGRSRAASLLAASVCGLSGPFVAWLEHPHTLTAGAVPWLLLAVRRAGRVARPWASAGVAATTALVLAGGHPETAMMAALLAAAFLVAGGQDRRAVAPALAGAVLGAGLAAPLLLPFLEYLLQSAAWIGADRYAAPLPLRDLLRLLTPSLRGSHPIEAAAYLSVGVLPLAVAGAFTGRRERDSRMLIVASASLLVAAYANPLSDLLASASTVRWSRTLLLLPIPVSLLAARGLDGLSTRARRAGRAAPHLAFGIAAGCAAELLAAARGVHAVAPENPLLRTPILERLAADPGPFRILPLHTFLPANTATSLGLDDLRGYDALAVRAFRTGREKAGRFRGVPTHTDVVAPWDLARGGRELDAWNVKYLLLHPQFAFSAATMNERLGLDLEEVYSGADGKLLLNRRAKSRARVESNGRDEGAVVIVDRTPTRWLFDVTAPAGGTLVVANAGYPGWRAYVDGRPARVGGGVGRRQEIDIASGRHRVDLAYRPLSFLLGLLVSAVTVLILGAGLARPHRSMGSRTGR